MRVVNSPPAQCRYCGWLGPAPGIHAENSTGITFVGCEVSCPRCGRMAQIVSGTYDFVGGVVRLVRDANLSLADLSAIRHAAQEARRTGQTQEAFVAANPNATPIVQFLIQHGKEHDWLVILLMILAIVIPALQSAEYRAVDERAANSRPPLTTQALSPETVAQIERRIETKLKPSQRAQERTPLRAKRKQPKRHGKNKRRHRR